MNDGLLFENTTTLHQRYPDHGSDDVISDNITSLFINFSTDVIHQQSDLHMGMGLRVSLSIIMACICVGSIFGNLLVFTSLVRERPLPNPAVQLIFRHLSLTNLLLAIVEPLVVVSLGCGKWIWGESMRLFEASWVTTFGLLAMMILALISFEQYSRFVKQKQLRIGQIAVMMGGIYCLAFVFGLSPLFGWCGYGPEGYGVSNSLKWNDLTENNAASYIVTIMICGYFCPLALIMYCYRAIYLLVQSQSNVAIVKTMISNNVTSLTVNRNHSLLVQERQLATTITFVILSFFLAWTPYVIVNLLNMFTSWVLRYKILATVPAMFAKSSTLWWIVIYSMVDKRIKKACRKTCQNFQRSFRMWYFSQG